MLDDSFLTILVPTKSANEWVLQMNPINIKATSKCNALVDDITTHLAFPVKKSTQLWYIDINLCHSKTTIINYVMKLI